MSPPELHIALLHYPVKNRRGDTIASAVTNLDIHDIARIGKTYGVAGVHLVTPLVDQQGLVQKILCHWLEGIGGDHNPDRREALRLVTVAGSLEAVKAGIQAGSDLPVRVAATGAAPRQNAMSFERFRACLRSREAVYVLAFGTAWGLSDAFMEAADLVLAPVQGVSGYNHLPVRAAAAIILDRIMA